jgi:diamine N-acetyltransferase
MQMLEGQHINLRPWQAQDLPSLTSLRNDVVLQGQLLARPRGSTLEQVQEWLEGFKNDPQSIFLVIADKTDVMLGFVQIKHIDTLNRSAELGIGVLKAKTGKGLGTEAIQLMADYLKKNWNLRKLTLQVRTDNQIAIAAYQKTGFSACGKYTDHVFIDGQWRDVTLMELFLQ